MSLHFSPKVRDHSGGVSFFRLWLWPPSRTDRGVPASALGLRAQYPALPEIRGALDRPRAMKMDERSRTPDRVHRNEAPSMEQLPGTIRTGGGDSFSSTCILQN